MSDLLKILDIKNKELDKLCRKFGCSREEMYRYLIEWADIRERLKEIKGLDKIKIVAEEEK